MKPSRLTPDHINARLTALERMMASVKPGRERKELPWLIAAYNRLMEIDPMITHVVQAYCTGMGWVDSKTATSLVDAIEKETRLRQDDGAWMPCHQGPNGIERKTRIVPVHDSNCADRYNRD